MNFSFDNKTGIAMVQFSDEKIADSDLVQNLVIDYNATGKIIAIEIMPFNIEEASVPQKNSRLNTSFR